MLHRVSPSPSTYFGTNWQPRHQSWVVALARGGKGYFPSPHQNDGPLNYFMYPYAEVDGKALDWLAAQKNLRYSISYKAL